MVSADSKKDTMETEKRNLKERGSLWGETTTKCLLIVFIVMNLAFVVSGVNTHSRSASDSRQCIYMYIYSSRISARSPATLAETSLATFLQARPDPSSDGSIARETWLNRSVFGYI